MAGWKFSLRATNVPTSRSISDSILDSRTTRDDTLTIGQIDLHGEDLAPDGCWGPVI
jgi:hypothetical protein